jgi:hypothetical protein
VNTARKVPNASIACILVVATASASTPPSLALF